MLPLSWQLNASTRFGGILVKIADFVAFQISIAVGLGGTAGDRTHQPTNQPLLRAY